jgi:membrane-bound lytic murein transglycosylase D
MKRTAHKTVVTGALLLGLGLPSPAVVQRRDGLPEGRRPAGPLLAVDRPVAPLSAELVATAALAAGVLWDLPVTRNAQVETWIAFLQGRNREKTELWLQRSGRYAPMIRQELRQRGMPEDLVYLAFIESGFSPSAYSRAKAAGIWQFIAETGRRYGLEVSSYVDERRDPLKATVAALEYLKRLHDQFGNWYLAAAAYNSGENRIARILRERREDARGNEELFWRIAPHLPQETRDYVPLMLAAGHIGKEPEKYGFVNLDYHVPLTFETVEVPGGTRLSTVARAIKVDADDVEELNPHLVRKMTPPGRLTAVRIPAGRDKRAAFHRAP